MLERGAEVDGQEVLGGDEGEGSVLVVVAAEQVVPVSCSQVYRYTGALVYRSTGILVYMYTSI